MLDYFVSYHEVPASDPAGGGLQLMAALRFTSQSLPLPGYDLNNIERDINQQIIIIIIITSLYYKPMYNAALAVGNEQGTLSVK